jgi:hypothetical protein
VCYKEVTAPPIPISVETTIPNITKYPILNIDEVPTGDAVHFNNLKELGFSYEGSSYAIVIKSSTELSDLCKNNDSIKQDDYDEDLFQEKALVFLSLRTGSPAVKYVLDSLIKRNNELFIRTTKVLGDSDLCVVGSWKFLFEVKKSDIEIVVNFFKIKLK